MANYTDEQHALIAIALLKAHGIRYVIASPGTTNMAFVGSIQTDPHFRIFSAVDERSAAYMACGLAAQTGEPVVLSCTGATASRNYLPGLTEAFYRKLPVLALTSMQGRARAGHHIPQVIDRSVLPKDAALLSVDLPIVKDNDDIWECEVKINRAILELSRRGGGPVHINLPTTYSRKFDRTSLPNYRVIKRWTASDELPKLNGRVGVFVGSHRTWTRAETAAVDLFCEANDAVVFCDHTSGYFGRYRILSALLGTQETGAISTLQPDVLIHIGEVSGDYDAQALIGREVWRVSPDGEVRDTFRKLLHVFEMPEHVFFTRYARPLKVETAYFDECSAAVSAQRERIPDLPFSNIWMASHLASRMPKHSNIHFSILNSLRAWNFFELPPDVRSSSNVGGFGIDGCTSSLIGASLADPESAFFLVTGDLAFFYDLNVLGNRHIGSNVRILLVNNGKGTEFTQYRHPGSEFGPDADAFIAAAGHFGLKSKTLVRNLAESFGFEYAACSSKSEAAETFEVLISGSRRQRPLIVEAFVDAEDESKALQIIKTLNYGWTDRARAVAKDGLGKNRVRALRKIFRRE